MSLFPVIYRIDQKEKNNGAIQKQLQHHGRAALWLELWLFG
jgi:hypothetical protein